jgi:hypothetical protein
MCNDAVFAFGIALFASSTLVSISVALMVLCIILTSGVMGRVAAMGIAAEIYKHNEPILYKVVKDRENAARYIDEIIKISIAEILLLCHGLRK